MEIIQLRLFHLVAENRSFSKTAKLTDRTQSAVSQQIKSLERELGAKLLDRSGLKKISITREGEIFRELTGGLLTEIESTKEKFSLIAHNNQSRGVLIHYDGVLSALLIGAAIKQCPFLLKDYSVSIYWYGMDTQKTIQLLTEDKADFFICRMDTIPEKIVYHEFIKTEYVALMNKKNRLASKEKITLNDLINTQIISFTKESWAMKILDELVKAKGKEISSHIEIQPFPQLLQTLISVDAGIAFVPKMWLDFMSFENACAKDVSHILGHHKVGIAYRLGKIFSKPASILISRMVPDLYIKTEN